MIEEVTLMPTSKVVQAWDTVALHLPSQSSCRRHCIVSVTSPCRMCKGFHKTNQTLQFGKRIHSLIGVLSWFDVVAKSKGQLQATKSIFY